MAKIVFTADSETGEVKMVANDQEISNVESFSFYNSEYSGFNVCVRTKREDKKGISVSYEVAMASKKDLSQEGYIEIDGGIYGKKVDEIADLSPFMKNIK